MGDTLLSSVLPYAVLAGIAASVIASLGLTLAALLRRRRDNLEHDDSDFLPRLSQLEESIRRDTSRIEMQLSLAGLNLKPDMARSVISDLSAIAGDLQDRASEVHRLLDELRSDRVIADSIDNRKKFVSLGLAVGQTESSIDAVVRRIEQKKQELGEL